MLTNESPLSALDFIAKSIKIPSIPTVYNDVCRITSDANASVQDVARVVETDQGVAARALKIANSAAMGLRSPVTSLDQACTALGTTRLRNLVLQTTLMQNYGSICAQGFDLDHFWKHTNLVGTVCRSLLADCKVSIGVTAEEAFTCGLLHDIGVLLMLESFPAAYMEAVQRSTRESIDLQDAEQGIFGFHHGEAGAVLARTWKFPTLVSEAARWHHQVPGGIQHEKLCLLVAAVNEFSEAIDEGSAPFESPRVCLERIESMLPFAPETIVAEIGKYLDLAVL